VASGVTLFLGSATGPRRLRAELRRATAAVKRAAAVPVPLRHVGFAFPAAVLGADVADLMGERLRAVLRFWDDQPGTEPDETEPRRAPLAQLGTASESRGERPHRNGSAGVADARHDWTMRAATAFAGTTRPPAARGQSPEARVPRLAAAEHHTSTAGAAPFVGRGAADAERDSASHEKVPPAAAVTSRGHSHERDRAAQSPLIAVLRAYWSHSTSEAERPRTETMAAAAESVRAVRFPRGAAAAVTARRAPDAAHAAQGPADSDRRLEVRDESLRGTSPVWAADARQPAVQSTVAAPLPALTLGARLRDILAVPAYPAADSAPARDDAAPGVDGWRATFGPGLARRAELLAAPAWAAGDLADQIADVLREQAIRQGIELT
jgi:hypothetical protein